MPFVKRVLKFIAHGRPVIKLAHEHGWRAGARYTNLRDIRGLPFEGVGFLDIHWKKYDFDRHFNAVATTKPLMTVARDVERIEDIDLVLREAEKLKQYSHHVIVVPKDPRLAGRFEELIPKEYILGFSVPTKYGGTTIDPHYFSRPVHLLGGRPDIQRRLAALMPVVSVDCNRFTLDAGFGDYFDGEKFRPHPVGGYRRCLLDSILNIEILWESYRSIGLRHFPE